MFGKLKEKFKNWTKKLSEEKTEESEGLKEEIEEIIEEKTEKKEKVKKDKETKSDKKKKEKEEKEKLFEKKETEEPEEELQIEEISGESEKEIKKEIKEENVEEKKEIFEKSEENINELEEEILEDDKEEIKEEMSGDKIEEGFEEKRKEVQAGSDLDKTLRGEIPVGGLKNFEEKKTDENSTDKKGFFKKIFSKVAHVTITEDDFLKYSEDLEMLLIENNVALEVAEKIIQDLKGKIVGKELSKKKMEEEISDSFRDVIEDILVEPFDVKERIKEKSQKPYVILFCGINGTGKTTTIAKIAAHLKKEKISCVLAAADTFRAASIEQIKKHSDKLGIKTIAHDYGADPAAVGFDAIKYAEKNKIDCVLIDTAGRMHTDKNLINQIEKISRVCKPDLKLFVGESITGNDIIEQVKSFDAAVKLDGIVLTKADIDEKGGAVLSVGYITKKPILYLGTGQEYHEIEVFDKKKFIEKLGL